MKEIESNKLAWSTIAAEHYEHFKTKLEQNTLHLNHYIQKEVGNLAGKRVLHLQCNTGADTLLLARLCESVTGIDLVPENIHYAEKLAADFGITNARFITADLMELSSIHHEQYDVVFTSEGVLGWLPDLTVWANTIQSLLKESGYLYVFDSHPMFLSFDESLLENQQYHIKYPYFGKTPDADDSIGGYACEPKYGVTSYFWMHPISEILNALLSAGLQLAFFNEYPENFFDSGNLQPSAKEGLFEYAYNKEHYPMSFSLKAVKKNA